MNISRIRFNGLTFWPLVQKLSLNRRYKPRADDVGRAMKAIANLSDKEKVAAFLLLGRLYTAIEDFERYKRMVRGE